MVVLSLIGLIAVDGVSELRKLDTSPFNISYLNVFKENFRVHHVPGPNVFGSASISHTRYHFQT
jgi:hypothetical protein